MLLLLSYLADVAQTHLLITIQRIRQILHILVLMILIILTTTALLIMVRVQISLVEIQDHVIPETVVEAAMEAVVAVGETKRFFTHPQTSIHT